MDNPFYTLGKGLGFRNKKTQIKPADPVKSFAEMTVKERKVAVAKDVLAQLRVNKLRMTRGTYCSGWVEGQLTDATTPAECADLMTMSCDVCAMGAVLVSHLRLANKTYGYNHGKYIYFESSGGGIVNLTKDTFTETELRDMEHHFERNLRTSPASKAMQAIMQFIVDNDGDVPMPWHTLTIQECNVAQK